MGGWLKTADFQWNDPIIISNLHTFKEILKCTDIKFDINGVLQHKWNAI